MNLDFLRRSGGKARDELRQNDSAGGKLQKRAARQAEKIGQSKTSRSKSSSEDAMTP
jgi:hypothetical protein